METWEVRSVHNCMGCVYLSNAGAFWTGNGPKPPLHDGCDCRRVAIRLSSLSTTAIQALRAEAARNSLRVDRLLRRALILAGRH